MGMYGDQMITAIGNSLRQSQYGLAHPDIVSSIVRKAQPFSDRLSNTVDIWGQGIGRTQLERLQSSLRNLDETQTARIFRALNSNMNGFVTALERGTLANYVTRVAGQPAQEQTRTARPSASESGTPRQASPAERPAATEQPAAQAASFTKDNVREILSRPITMDTMRELQQGLGIEADGKFGPQTLAALRTFMGAESLGDLSASNWAVIARGARDAAGANWIKTQIGDNTALRQAVAGNIAPRISAEAGSLAANQYQSSLSVLGYLDGAKIGTIDQATYDALGQAHTDFESIVSEFTPPAAEEAVEETADAEGADGSEVASQDIAQSTDAEAIVEELRQNQEREAASGVVTGLWVVPSNPQALAGPIGIARPGQVKIVPLGTSYSGLLDGTGLESTNAGAFFKGAAEGTTVASTPQNPQAPVLTQRAVEPTHELAPT